MVEGLGYLLGHFSQCPSKQLMLMLIGFGLPHQPLGRKLSESRPIGLPYSTIGVGLITNRIPLQKHPN